MTSRNEAEAWGERAERERNEERDRRAERDRRRRVWWSVFYGSFNPRRRRPPRRIGDASYHSVDWHASHLLAVAIFILLLSMADAGLTLFLLGDGGAVEANPVMALLVGGDAMLFAALKMAMTGVSVILMVSLARYRFMRVVRVEIALYGILIAYVCLIGYELSMIHAHGHSFPF
ncbi:MAG: DUF5658 family protein [Steroidobacteraceae bacterium]|jgi:hypothetical protein